MISVCGWAGMVVRSWLGLSPPLLLEKIRVGHFRIAGASREGAYGGNTHRSESRTALANLYRKLGLRGFGLCERATAFALVAFDVMPKKIIAD